MVAASPMSDGARHHCVMLAAKPQQHSWHRNPFHSNDRDTAEQFIDPVLTRCYSPSGS